jgi:hypothetical protein
MTIAFYSPIEQNFFWPISNIPTVTNRSSATPASDLLSYSPADAVAITADNSAITWDFGQPRQFDCVALLSHSMSWNSRWTIEVSSNGSSWTTVFTGKSPWSHFVDPYSTSYTYDELTDPRLGSYELNHAFWNASSTQFFRYLRVTVSDYIKTSFSIGRLFVGRRYSPQKNYQYGSSVDFGDSGGRRERTDSGNLILFDGRPVISASIKMEFLTEAEVNGFVYDLNYWRKTTRELLVNLDVENIPNLQRNLIYGTLTETRKVVAEEFNAFSSTWTIESI